LAEYAKPALPVLFEQLTDDCAAVRSTSVQAIWRITGDRTPARQAGRAFLQIALPRAWSSGGSRRL
jgi:hypothetical protein